MKHSIKISPGPMQWKLAGWLLQKTSCQTKSSGCFAGDNASQENIEL